MTRISQINEFLDFDYSSVFEKDSFFSYFVSPVVPFAAVLLYLIVSKPLFKSIRLTFRLDPKGSILQNLTVVHSLILAVYSGWTCYHSVPLVLKFMNQYGFWGTLCDSNQILWKEYNFSFWLTHFYISKFYEFIDTWIILCKGREPIFLQTFHHAGIAILLWGFVVTSNSIGLVIVCFNSFIHTLMYTYYFLAAFGYKSPLKHYLTIAQITQFILGMVLTIPAHFIGSCLTPAQSLVLGITQVYTIILIVLFLAFYSKSYNTRRVASDVDITNIISSKKTKIN